MLPAPTTTATSTCCSRTFRTWAAIRPIRAGSVPYSREPINASPESFRMIRLKRGSAATRLLLPDLEPAEAGDSHILSRLGGDVGDHLLDRLGLVLLDVEVLLLQQRALGAPLFELALDDLLDDVVGLALLLGLLGEDLAFATLLVGGDVLGGDVAGVHRRDVDGDLTGERLELLVARDEVGFALDLDQRPLCRRAVDVGRHDSLAGSAPASLGGRSRPLLAQDLDCLVDVAAGLDQGLLAVHHRRAGLLAQRLDVGGARSRLLDHQDPFSSPPPAGAGCSLPSGRAGDPGSAGASGGGAAGASGFAGA